MSRASIVALALAAAVLLPGCGGSRTRPYDVTTPAVPAGRAPVSFPASGVTLAAVPANWRVQEGQPPMVATIASGDGTLAIWRYQRSQPLPQTRAALHRALAALIAAVRARDASFQLLRSKTTRVDDKPAIVLLGLDTIDGNRRETRSTHVFAYGTEVVLDAYAPAATFLRSDRLVFLPIVRSMRLRHP